VTYFSAIVSSLIAYLSIAVTLCSAQNASSSGPASSRPLDKTAEQVYKNIQILRGIPAEQLIPAMEFITTSLGVQCGFCHVEQHFDRDDKKPKQQARKMIQMMTAINQANFDGHLTITCNTCHRGSRLPVAIPALREGAEVLPLTASNDDKFAQSFPSADELVKKLVQAEGGTIAIQKIATRVESGTVTFGGGQFNMEIFDRTPDKRALIIHLREGDSITAIDGDKGWLVSPHRQAHSMPRAEVEAARMDADLQLPLHLQQLFTDLRPAPPDKIEGRDAYQLVATVAGNVRARLYFDQQSGLLLRILRYTDTPLGPNPTQIEFGDYRPVDGVQVSFRWTTTQPAGQFTTQLTDVKQNVIIEDEKFTTVVSP
jgi:photosynthetic reaction center cytochrome c subunit